MKLKDYNTTLKE